MGKKGGKKGKIDKAVENAEPNLPTIIEEVDQEVKNEVTSEQPETEESAPVGHKSILKVEKSNVELEKGKSTKSLLIEETGEGEVNDLEAEKPKSQVAFGTLAKPENADESNVEISLETKNKKPKKEKKAKKAKKEKPEKSEEDAEEKPAKKGKKGKKLQPTAETEEEAAFSPSTPQIDEPSAETTEAAKETKKGKKKAKKEKLKDDKEGQKGKGSPEKETERRSESVSVQREESRRDTMSEPREREKSRVSVAEQTKSGESLAKKKKVRRKDSAAPRDDRRSSGTRDSLGSDVSDGTKPRPSFRRSSAARSSMAVYDQRRTTLSKISALSSDSSGDVDDVRSEKGKRGGKKNKKKDKKQKDEKKKATDEVEPEETEEEKERKRAEKEAEKLAKKEARKAARKAAKEKKKAEKAGKAKPGDDLKKKLDEMRKLAKEMGIDLALEDLDQVPKKKGSKKEKAKLTAEMAEKVKAEMEVQAKRMEEMIKKKKEEDRLAAIEKDKREVIEQGLRIEHLQESMAGIQDIEETNAEISKEEKELLEWKKYVECGKLPDPAMCNQMNTYLHLWELNLEQTSIEDASNRTTDAIKLLNELDDLVETVTDEDADKLENWKWVRQLFRDYQKTSLDVATYRLLRDVEHNLNRINIPTADFNFKDDYVTLCIWLRVMLPIPLPNPRRPPKPRIDISFNAMNVSVLFPLTIDCENAAIRAMYLKYDHLSDLSETFHMPDVPKDYYMDLLAITKKEWRTQLVYKYDNRDRLPKQAIRSEAQEEGPSDKTVPNPEETPEDGGKIEPEKKITFEEEVIGSDDDIPLVPYKQLKPTASEYAISVEDELYNDTRSKLRIEVPENVINLRKFVILGGVFHLDLLAQPPQPQDFITMDLTITGLYLPKKLEVLPFKVVYTPYVPPEPEPVDSDTSVRKLPEELEEEIKKQEEELDKLIAINMKWPPHVIFLELPIICRWDDEKRQWSNEEIYDIKHNEDKCMLSFRTGVFGIYALAIYRYSNLPFQAYDIKPEIDESVTVQLTAAILMLEFNIKDGLIALTQLQNSPNMTLQDVVGKYMKLHQLKRMMKEAGIDIFPAFDAFCYVDGCCEKQWAMEQHLYHNMAQLSSCFNFAWSRWNLQAGRRKIVLQMRQYSPEKGKQKNHQMLLVTPLKTTFIECTEVSQAFSDKEVESIKFCADLLHLMKATSGIFVRNKVGKASKQNVYTLAQFLISIRILSFS